MTLFSVVVFQTPLSSHQAIIRRTFLIWKMFELETQKNERFYQTHQNFLILELLCCSGEEVWSWEALEADLRKVHRWSSLEESSPDSGSVESCWCNLKELHDLSKWTFSCILNTRFVFCHLKSGIKADLWGFVSLTKSKCAFHFTDAAFRRVMMTLEPRLTWTVACSSRQNRTSSFDLNEFHWSSENVM